MAKTTTKAAPVSTFSTQTYAPVPGGQQAAFMTLEGGPNPITVGTVPMGQLSFRRENYRQMTKSQLETLRGSTKSLGFQSLIVVVKEADGTYGIVDGHHRRDELERLGSAVAPVLLLPEGLDPTKADLGMLGFNVSAEIKQEAFAKFVEDLLEKGVDTSELQVQAGVSEEWLKTFQEAMSEPVPELDGGGGDLPHEGSGKSKAKKPPNVKVVLLLNVDKETGNSSPAVFMVCPRDTILSKGLRDDLESTGLALEEIDPVYFASEEDFSDALAQFQADQPEEPASDE